eukprot:747492-Hanusia_phi.AAC.1
MEEDGEEKEEEVGSEEQEQEDQPPKVQEHEHEHEHEQEEVKEGGKQGEEGMEEPVRSRFIDPFAQSESSGEHMRAVACVPISAHSSSLLLSMLSRSQGCRYLEKQQRGTAHHAVATEILQDPSGYCFVS